MDRKVREKEKKKKAPNTKHHESIPICLCLSDFLMQTINTAANTNKVTTAKRMIRIRRQDESASTGEELFPLAIVSDGGLDWLPLVSHLVLLSLRTVA